MDEVFKIFEAEIDTQKATENVRALKATLQNLKEESEKVKASQGALSDEYIEYQAAIISTTTELRKAEAVTQAVVTANNSQTGSLVQLKSQLKLVSDEWEKLSEEERVNSDRGKGLAKAKLDLTNKLKGEEMATGSAGRNVGFYSEGMQAALDATDNFVPGAGKATSAAKALGIGFKVMLGPVGIAIAIIGAIVAAVKSFFESSEEGQNKLAVFSAAFSAAFGVINDILSTFGEMIVAAFENPKQAIADLWQAIKTNIINRFTGLIDMAKGLGKVLKGVFTLDWDLLKEGAAEYGESFVQALTGVDNLIGKVIDGAKELGKEIAEKAKIAMYLADLQAKLDKQMRAATVQNAKDSAESAKLREQVMIKENKTAEERLALLDQAIALETKIEERNVAIAKQKYLIKKEQNALAKSNKDALNEEANLLAAVFNAEMAASMKRKELQGQRAELLNQEIAKQRELSEVAIGVMEYELAQYKASLDKRQGLTQKGVTDEIAILKAGMELKKAEIDSQENIDQALKDARKLELQNEFNLASAALDQAFKDEQKAKAAEAAQIDYQNELATLEGNIFGKIELERQGLELKKQQELEYADLIGSDRELIIQKYNQQEIALEQLKQNAKLELMQGYAGNLATIFGENTKVGKSAAAAETVINTYKSAMSAYSSLSGIPIVGPVLGAVAAAAAVKTGFDAVKKIYAVKTDAKGGGTVSVGALSISKPSTSAASTPAVFQASQAVTPQTAASIAAQNAMQPTTTTEPSQQVLVVDDVTFNQNMANRNDRLGEFI